MAIPTHYTFSQMAQQIEIGNQWIISIQSVPNNALNAMENGMSGVSASTLTNIQSLETTAGSWTSADGSATTIEKGNMGTFLNALMGVLELASGKEIPAQYSGLTIPAKVTSQILNILSPIFSSFDPILIGSDSGGSGEAYATHLTTSSGTPITFLQMAQDELNGATNTQLTETYRFPSITPTYTNPLSYYWQNPQEMAFSSVPTSAQLTQFQSTIQNLFSVV